MSFWDTYHDGTPMTPLPKGSMGGGLGHCNKCDNPRMTYVTCYPKGVNLCEEHTPKDNKTPYALVWA